MAEFVEFDGNKIGIDKQYKLIDSPKNIKKIASHYKKLLEKINEGDDSLASLAEYTPLLAEIVGEATADMLALDQKEKKTLEDFSFSDQYAFFNECMTKFIGISLPSKSDDEKPEEKKEDPKSQEEEPSTN